MRSYSYVVSKYTMPFRLFFFFNDTATTEIYTLSLHDALPISRDAHHRGDRSESVRGADPTRWFDRSEEHTSELQSHLNIVCRLLLEKKNKTIKRTRHVT